MSNSALIKSSIAKKYWMALTGLFLCTFLVGHLLGNLQLVSNELSVFINFLIKKLFSDPENFYLSVKSNEEVRRAFNEYAYFMGHNIFIKVLSYVTYASILFHAVDGIMLTIQNKKARPVNYAFNNPTANSSLPSRWMAVLGTLILVFIATHMANFWWKMKIKEDVPLHTYKIESDQPNPAIATEVFYYTHIPTIQPIPKDEKGIEEKGTELYYKGTNIKIGEGYRDLHTVVIEFFSKSNSSALFGVLFYTISMLVLGFHLWHGFASAFQSLGVNHAKWNPLIKGLGKGFAVLIPALFAIIPILIYLKS